MNFETFLWEYFNLTRHDYGELTEQEKEEILNAWYKI